MNKDSFRGVITPILTPFDASGALMPGAVGPLVRYQIDHGVQGLFVCGSTGMGTMMSTDERKKLAETVVREVDHRVPTIIQVGTPDTQTAVELARHAEAAGADAVASLPPYYYRHMEESLMLHFQSVARSVSVPMFIYNIPRFAGTNVEPSLMRRLAEAGIAAGAKDSSNDFMQLLKIIEMVPEDFAVINGAERYMLPALMMGARGIIPALANAFPELFVGLYKAHEAGDCAKGRELQRRLNRIKDVTDAHSLSSLYEILKHRGVSCGEPRAPFRAATGKEVVRTLRESGEL
ncbi:MAG: dihydrodipicolinate synthase family protein [Nitrososphaerota archaeon]|nr:dihydrodipicolinate synthase family protein [Nitrososphaerota archaeon]MDG6938952.1 dihydrodipicolinate synthase family protein [Nitrososphaerota archaeon]